MDDLKKEVYKTVFETWRYEVDSYWQRNNYFAAFETVALAGCWYVVEHAHRWVGLAFSVAGFVSATIWLITSVAVHRYLSYWWRSIQEIEAAPEFRKNRLDFATRHPGSRGLHPSFLVHVIPALFMFTWIVILLFTIHCLCAGCKPG
jgi:hypothetical protein